MSVVTTFDFKGQIPLAEASFTSWYGIVVDRFGIAWQINVETEGSR